MTSAVVHGRHDLREQDLPSVLASFYDAVGNEPLLAPYFAELDMATHLPRIVDFWSTMLFHTGRYASNAFAPHLNMPGLTTEHFSRWLGILETTVNNAHAGPNAECMKELGHRVAYSMQLRLGLAPAATLSSGVISSSGSSARHPPHSAPGRPGMS